MRTCVHVRLLVGFVRQSKEKALRTLRTLIRLLFVVCRSLRRAACSLTHSLGLQPTTHSQTIHIEATATAVCNIKSTVNVRTCCFHSSWLSKCRPQGGGWLCWITVVVVTMLAVDVVFSTRVQRVAAAVAATTAVVVAVAGVVDVGAASCNTLLSSFRCRWANGSCCCFYLRWCFTSTVTG